MSRGPAAALILLSAVILLLSATATSAHNITHMLEEFPEFGVFNGYLSQTNLSGVINRRKSLTVLAISNDHIGPLSGKPVDVLRRLLMTHVILDYYDSSKLNKLKLASKTMVTTLYQSSGTADDQQGFLGIVHTKNGSIGFGSNTVGAPKDAVFLGEVSKLPYNISVLSISHPIFAPGIDPSAPILPPPPKGSLAPPPEEEVPAPPAESPEEDPEPPTNQPPEAAPSPAADAPDSPDDNTPDADSQSQPKSPNAAAKQLVQSLGGFMLAIFASFFIAA
ncbi:hypothetical protein ACJIZ3_001720 [Penstemon smallii]|uniref:FAS1 domain-containing protein n=1 Tax=Penstemon smallii TaxID=265156 RepID=A0ABD3U5G2_9LAMI